MVTVEVAEVPESSFDVMDAKYFGEKAVLIFD